MKLKPSLIQGRVPGRSLSQSPHQIREIRIRPNGMAAACQTEIRPNPYMAAIGKRIKSASMNATSAAVIPRLITMPHSCAALKPNIQTARRIKASSRRSPSGPRDAIGASR